MYIGVFNSTVLLAWLPASSLPSLCMCVFSSKLINKNNHDHQSNVPGISFSSFVYSPPLESENVAMHFAGACLRPQIELTQTQTGKPDADKSQWLFPHRRFCPTFEHHHHQHQQRRVSDWRLARSSSVEYQVGVNRNKISNNITSMLTAGEYLGMSRRSPPQDQPPQTTPAMYLSVCLSVVRCIACFSVVVESVLARECQVGGSASWTIFFRYNIIVIITHMHIAINWWPEYIY